MDSTLFQIGFFAGIVSLVVVVVTILVLLYWILSRVWETKRARSERQRIVYHLHQMRQYLAEFPDIRYVMEQLLAQAEERQYDMPDVVRKKIHKRDF
jgi:hypothetical protein